MIYRTILKCREEALFEAFVPWEKVIAELKPENLPKQYFFRTDESVKTLSFDKVKRQVIG